MEIPCLIKKDKVKILPFLAKPELPVYSMVNTQGWIKLVSKLKSQETVVPNKDVVLPQQADIERLVQENEMLKTKIFKLSMKVKSMNITKRENFGKEKPHRKKLFPFCPENLKLDQVPHHELIEWYYGNDGRPYHPRSKEGHIWVDVPSDICSSVQDDTGTTSIPDVYKEAAPNIPKQDNWVHVPEKGQRKEVVVLMG